MPTPQPNRRRALVCVVLLVVGLASFWILNSKNLPHESTPTTSSALTTANQAPPLAVNSAPITQPSSASPAPSATVTPAVATPEIPRSPLADALGAPGTAPEREPAIVMSLCEAYAQQIRSFPMGEDNQEITRALTGHNKAALPFLPPDHSRINPNGELVDAWNTPFFFHLLSRTQIELRSAGPDRKLYTEDDILVTNRE